MKLAVKDILRHIPHQMQNRMALVRACFGGWKGDGHDTIAQVTTICAAGATSVRMYQIGGMVV
jgi:hypothetical protein